jgi:hypothetical protein
VKVEDAEASVAAAVVLQTTGIDAAPIRLTTRYQELRKRGSGLRSVDKMFRRTVKSLHSRAETGGYPGGYEERYRLDWAWRKERLMQNLNFHSYQEAMAMPVGHAKDPNWLRGTGRSAAAYGKSRDPAHLVEYRTGQLNTWADQYRRGYKGKDKGKGKRGKPGTWVDDRGKNSWYNRLDFTPAERPEGANPRGQTATTWLNNASWQNDWVDYSDDRSRKAARYAEPVDSEEQCVDRVSAQYPTSEPTSGSNATRWEQGYYDRDYARIQAAPAARLTAGPGPARGSASSSARGSRDREPISEGTATELAAIDWSQHFADQVIQAPRSRQQTFVRDVREIKSEDLQPEREP